MKNKLKKRLLTVMLSFFLLQIFNSPVHCQNLKAKLLKIDSQVVEDCIEVQLHTQNSIGEYKTFFLMDDNPSKFVIDIKGKWKNELKSVFKMESNVVERIRIGEHPTYLRVVFDMKNDERLIHELKKTGDGLLIALGKQMCDKILVSSDGDSYHAEQEVKPQIVVKSVPPIQEQVGTKTVSNNLMDEQSPNEFADKIDTNYQGVPEEKRGRKGRFEAFLLAQSLSSDTTSGRDGTLEMDNTFAGGIGLGWNINNYLNLNTNFSYGKSDIVATVSGNRLKGDYDVYIGSLNLDYYPLKSRFTPLITGGIGNVVFDGEYGNNSFREYDFSYNLGAGFRYDITDHLFFKALYRIIWVEMEDSDDKANFEGVNINAGYVF